MVESENNNKENYNGQEFSYELKIPEERIAVLIGKDGETKKEIEENTKCSLDISKEGDVIITGEDALLLYTTREIVHAIARGFNPKIALLLLKTDYTLDLIDMKDVAGKSKDTMLRLKGRVIGKGGRSRELIEQLTDTYISVYGKTIGMIGETDKVALARQAVGMLLSGSMHKTVYQFLERKRKEIMFG
ncbi:MAG: KH domain-containing protein [Nanoarchaeota archaeon]|nr:KH domain-containing protein [Nanoarchaeota archaeon]MBU1632055.1 KH domain-containing protein [Nanoarchaeota archaeon]MBU1875818.1 KH domain-containing protein [Nanoarchaeota archaeon]